MNSKHRRRRRRYDGFWVTVVVFAALAACAVLAIVAIQRPGFREWLISDESGSATIRNIGLLVGGIVAIALAVWRSRVSERQAATAERGLLNERYQQGAEMLGSKVLAVRIGGVHALHSLAREHPLEYHVQIMYLFCAFACNPPKGDNLTTEMEVSGQPFRMLRADVQSVLGSFRTRRITDIALEQSLRFVPRLHFANLRGADFNDTDLRGALLLGADLSYAYFANGRLDYANLFDANLSGTQFSDKGDISATGLTQEQLDEAVADPADPPELIGVYDAETGKPLIWRGRRLGDDAGGDR